jgi:hypothetical protein
MAEKSSWIITPEEELPFAEPGGIERAAFEPDALEAEGEAARAGWRETLSELAGVADIEALLRFLKRSQRVLIALAFLGGFMAGWIIIGRWLWPANRNADPWELRRQHQATYVSLVAQEYASTGDVIRAKNSLEGWEEEALTDLVVEMAGRASSLEERQRLTALAKALQLPDYRLSLATSFFLNKGIVLSFVLSALPLIAAMVMVVAPLFKGKERQENAEWPDGLLPDDPETLEEMRRQGLLETGSDGENGLAEDDGTGALGGQNDGAAEGEAEDLDELEEEEEDADADDDWEEWDDDEEIETEGAVADILMDLFDEEDGSLAYLESLAKRLSDVDIDELLIQAQEIVHHFQTQERRAP